MTTTQKVLQVMKRNHICVLSSIGPEGEPQSAVVGYSEDERGWLVIGTNRSSRKYRNVIRDPRVSVVIGWDNNETVQYQGNAHDLHGDNRVKYQELHVAKHPSNERFKDDPTEVYILIEPTWVRYTDTNVRPWRVTEVKEMYL